MQAVVYARALERYIEALLRSLLSCLPPVKRWRAQNDLGASAHFKQACANDDSKMLAAALTAQPIAPLCAQSLRIRVMLPCLNCNRLTNDYPKLN
jgi:hypothetical protein